MSEQNLDSAIVEALDKELGTPAEAEAEWFKRIRTLVGNCLTDNYDTSDVKAAIEMAMAKVPPSMEEEDG